MFFVIHPTIYLSIYNRVLIPANTGIVLRQQTKALSVASYWPSRRHETPSINLMLCWTHVQHRWMGISIRVYININININIHIYIYIYICIDVHMVLDSDNWLIGNVIVTREWYACTPCHVSPSSLPLSVTNSGLQTWNLSRSVNPT